MSTWKDRLFLENVCATYKATGMTTDYPKEFSLENGSHVSVEKTGPIQYTFTIKPEEGPSRQFTYVHDGKTREEAEQTLNFEEIDALRRFWLETSDLA